MWIIPLFLRAPSTNKSYIFWIQFIDKQVSWILVVADKWGNSVSNREKCCCRVYLKDNNLV